MTSVSNILTSLQGLLKAEPEDDAFWLEEEEGKNYSGVLVSVADSERYLEL